MAQLSEVQQSGVTILSLAGSLTSEGVEKILSRFQSATRQPGARVVVDLSGVDVITTPALSMFIAATQQARQTGGRIIFTRTTPLVRELMRRLHLDGVLPTAPDLQQAIDAANA